LITDLIQEKARPAATKPARESGPRLSMQELLAAAPPQRYALLLAHVQKSLAQVMALDAPELDPEESMSNLGLDSLMALELQHSLEETFGTKLPLELLMGMPSLNEFVKRLLEMLAKPAAPLVPQAAPEMLEEATEPREMFPPIVGA
jgi:acyl carrier protein